MFISLQVIEELQNHYSFDTIKLIKRPEKLGLGSAYIDGAKHCKGDFIFLMDADFSHHVISIKIRTIIVLLLK